MGREVRRVPLDFDWPMNTVWEGFLTPDNLHENPCTDCFSSGSTPARQWLDRVGLMIDQLVQDVDDQAAGKNMHPWLKEDSYPPVDRSSAVSRNGFFVNYEVVRPSEDILEFAQALVKDDEYEHNRVLSRGSFAQNRYAITSGLIRSAGLPKGWGVCPTCDGRGSVEAYEGQRAAGDAWEPTGPPEGEGWQLWETVSEGSPISPVFEDSEGLVSWMISPEYEQKLSPLTRAQAENFVNSGSAPSFVLDNSGLRSGEQWVGDNS